MKYLKQFGILAAVTCAGEVLKFFIPLPVPGSIYGLLLLLALLSLRVLKVEQVKDAAEFLIEIMPVMFIPAAVGLVVVWPTLSEMLLPVCVITVISTFVVMAATGRTAEAMLKMNSRGTAAKESREGTGIQKEKEGKHAE